MLAVLVVVLVAALLAGLVYALGSPGRYEQMTEAEFEEEARKKSLLAAGIVGLQKVLEPSKVEYVLEEQNRAKRDVTQSGDPPSAGGKDQARSSD